MPSLAPRGQHGSPSEPSFVKPPPSREGGGQARQPLTSERNYTSQHALWAVDPQKTTPPSMRGLKLCAQASGARSKVLRWPDTFMEPAMPPQGSACEPPPDVDTDDCLHEYCYLFSPDILKDKVAFITGGGSGIGFRIAEVLMRHGCQTVIASRNLQKLTEASQKLSAATGQRCLPLSLDVRQPQAIAAAVDEALKEFSRIDILVNNAAGNFLCPASSLSFNAYKTVIDIDTLGTFNVSKVLYDKCLRDHGGVIVNITATLCYRGQALQVHAGTAKAAVDAMTKHLAVEWGPNRIRVNSLAPGPITGTEGFRRLGGHHAESSGIYQTIPLLRMGNKTEIAHSVLYLASPLASYVTGTTLVVDGGSWLTTPNDFPSLLGVWAMDRNKDK